MIELEYWEYWEQIKTIIMFIIIIFFTWLPSKLKDKRKEEMKDLMKEFEDEIGPPEAYWRQDVEGAWMKEDDEADMHISKMFQSFHEDDQKRIITKRERLEKQTREHIKEQGVKVQMLDEAIEIQKKKNELGRLKMESQGFFHVIIDGADVRDCDEYAEYMKNVIPKNSSIVVTDERFKIETLNKPEVKEIYIPIEPKLCKICNANLIPPFEHCEYCDTWYGIPTDALPEELEKEYKEGEKKFNNDCRNCVNGYKKKDAPCFECRDENGNPKHFMPFKNLAEKSIAINELLKNGLITKEEAIEELGLKNNLRDKGLKPKVRPN